MTKLLLLLATFFSLTNADYNLRQEIFSKNIHNRDFYEEKFINWVSQFNIDIKDGSKFVHMLSNFANNDDIIVIIPINTTNIT